MLDQKFIKWLDTIETNSKEYDLLNNLLKSFHEINSNLLTNFFNQYDWIKDIKLISYFEDCEYDTIYSDYIDYYKDCLHPDFNKHDNDVKTSLIILLTTINNEQIELYLPNHNGLSKNEGFSGYLYLVKSNNNFNNKYDELNKLKINSFDDLNKLKLDRNEYLKLENLLKSYLKEIKIKNNINISIFEEIFNKYNFFNYDYLNEMSIQFLSVLKNMNFNLNAELDHYRSCPIRNFQHKFYKYS